MRLFPKALVFLRTRVLDQDYQMTIAPISAKVTRRSHDQADTADVELLAAQLPFDFRQLDSILVQVYAGDVDTLDGSVQGEGFLRFSGYVDDHGDEHPESETPTIKLTARDHSALLRDIKVLPTAARPRYSDTVSEAIHRILNAHDDALLAIDGGIAGDADVLDQPLASVAHARHGHDPVALPHDVTPWAAIEFISGMVGALATLDINTIVVQRPDSRYDPSAAPAATLIYGSEDANLLSYNGKKKYQRNRKGVRCVAWNPETRRQMVAVYPPDAELRALQRHHARPQHAHSAPRPVDREIYPINGITDQDALQRAAQSIYEENSRYEAELSCMTPMFTTAMCSLKNGDRIRFALNPDVQRGVLRQTTPEGRVRYLQHRLGLEAEAARVLLLVIDRPETDLFYARQVTLDYAGENFSSVSIDLINLLRVDP